MIPVELRPGFPGKQRLEEAASYILETNRVPDPYSFLVGEDKLYTPAGIPVEASITTDSPIEKSEWLGFQAIQKWAIQSEQGVIVWFSPVYPGIYPTAKAIFSQIVYDFEGNKYLSNRAVLFDHNQPLKKLFNKLCPGIKLSSLEELRQAPQVLKESQAESWPKILSEIDRQQAQMIITRQDWEFKHRVLDLLRTSQEPDLYDFAQNSGLVGKHQSSCPVNKSAFMEMFGSSLIMGEQYFECPSCHRSIPSGFGITTCPHCGAKKEDFQNCV